MKSSFRTLADASQFGREADIRLDRLPSGKYLLKLCPASNREALQQIVSFAEKAGKYVRCSAPKPLEDWGPLLSSLGFAVDAAATEGAEQSYFDRPPGGIAKASRPQDHALLYHGTPQRSRADMIQSEGLQPGRRAADTGWTTPVSDRVYLTPNLSYAVRYAFEGKYGGRSRAERDEPDGFVFVVDPRALEGRSIQPDEDSIGQFLARHAERVFPGEGHDRSPSDWKYRFKPNGSDDDERREIWQFIHDFPKVPALYRARAIAHHGAAQAWVGKTVVETMPSWMQSKLLGWGADWAVQGSVAPTERLAFKKADARKLLLPDASNLRAFSECTTPSSAVSSSAPFLP